MYRQVFLVGLVLIMATAGVETQYVKADGGPGFIGGPDVNFNYNKEEQHGDTYEHTKIGPYEHDKWTHNPGGTGDEGAGISAGGGSGSDSGVSSDSGGSSDSVGQ